MVLYLDKGKGDDTVRVPAWAHGTVIPTRSRRMNLTHSIYKKLTASFISRAERPSRLFSGVE